MYQKVGSMPPLQPVEKVVKVVLSGTFGVSTWANVFHARPSANALTQADVNAIGAAYRLQFKNQFLPRMSSGATLKHAEAVDLSAVPLAAYEADFSDVGADGSGMAEANLAAVVSWKTNQRYRGGHSRTYIGGLGVGSLNPPVALSGSAKTDLQTAATAFLAGLTGTALSGSQFVQPCVVSYRRHNTILSPTTSPAGPIVADITSGIAKAFIHSQRRRLGKHST